LFHALTNKPVPTTRLHIQMDLPPNIFIKRQKALILCLHETHFQRPATKPERDFISLVGHVQPPDPKRTNGVPWSHGRGIGRLFGKGICPVIGRSLVPTDACALNSPGCAILSKHKLRPGHFVIDPTQVRYSFGFVATTL
jgi:hypothetical protein